jgi:hypothetical protein
MDVGGCAMTLNREAVEPLLKFDETGESASFRLHVPSLSCGVTANVDVPIGSTRISDKSLETLNDIATLTPEACAKIRQLLFDDAVKARESSDYGNPNTPPRPQAQTNGFWKKLVAKQKDDYRFVPLAHDDPRHPCYFEHGTDSVDAKVVWNDALVSEHVVSNSRLALLRCTPAWEEEHGVCVVLRDGEPIGLTGDYGTGLFDYEDGPGVA